VTTITGDDPVEQVTRIPYIAGSAAGASRPEPDHRMPTRAVYQVTSPPGSPRRGRRRRQRSSSAGLIAGVSALVLGVILIGIRFVPGSPLSAQAATAGTAGAARLGHAAASPSPSPLPPLEVAAADVTVNADHFWSWALMDERTGKITGSDNMDATSTTASMIKSWIAADYLRRNAENDQTPSNARMNEVSIMIRDSDNNAATDLYSVVGKSSSTKRMIAMCGMTDSFPGKVSWSDTLLSARDTVRLADCIADGRAAGPKWTDWLLNEMRDVRGVGDFGIRKAFPAAESKTIAIKNGWVVWDDDGLWHLNCLAIGDDWTMGIMMRYPAAKGFAYGSSLCKSIASQLRT
jgi:hypothetical protein